MEKFNVYEEMSDPNNSIPELLRGFVEQQIQITVWAGRADRRDTFECSISVCGKLEPHPSDPGEYRILQTTGTYAYFGLVNIENMTIHPDQFKDGSKAVIKINL